MSKTRLKGVPQCDKLSENDSCPECNEVCEHGYQLDGNGCRTCECLDPCERISCRGEGETCRLVAVDCVDWPCPSVAMCLPKKENPCQNGEPLEIGGEVASCGPEIGGCPSSHKCQLSPVGEYAVCCPKPSKFLGKFSMEIFLINMFLGDVCFETLDRGKCSENSKNLTRFYFNSKTNKCISFIYTGCEGNHNNFHSEDICNSVCPGILILNAMEASCQTWRLLHAAPLNAN